MLITNSFSTNRVYMPTPIVAKIAEVCPEHGFDMTALEGTQQVRRPVLSAVSGQGTRGVVLPAVRRRHPINVARFQTEHLFREMRQPIMWHLMRNLAANRQVCVLGYP
jgi:hypothetical protein